MRKDRAGVLFLLVLVGALLGSAIGEALKGLVPILGTGISIGVVPPTTVDLFVMRITLGFEARLSIASAVGILLALLVYRRS